MACVYHDTTNYETITIIIHHYHIETTTISVCKKTTIIIVKKNTLSFYNFLLHLEEILSFTCSIVPATCTSAYVVVLIRINQTHKYGFTNKSVHKALVVMLHAI